MTTQNKHTALPWQFMEVGNTYKVCTLDGQSFVDRNHYLAGAPFICDINDDFSTDKEHEESHKVNYYSPILDPERLQSQCRFYCHRLQLPRRPGAIACKSFTRH